MYKDGNICQNGKSPDVCRLMPTVEDAFLMNELKI